MKQFDVFNGEGKSGCTIRMCCCSVVRPKSLEPGSVRRSFDGASSVDCPELEIMNIQNGTDFPPCFLNLSDLCVSEVQGRKCCYLFAFSSVLMTILFLRGLRKRTRSFRSVPSPPPSKRQSIEIGNIDPVKLEERLTELYGAGCFQINVRGCSSHLNVGVLTRQLLPADT